jgi:ketosteroid isomerase-like protein
LSERNIRGRQGARRAWLETLPRAWKRVTNEKETAGV